MRKNGRPEKMRRDVSDLLLIVCQKAALVCNTRVCHSGIVCTFFLSPPPTSDFSFTSFRGVSIHCVGMSVSFHILLLKSVFSLLVLRY